MANIEDKVKYHTILQNFSKQMNGHELTNTVEFAGHTFLLSTLSATEEVIADGLISSMSFVQQAVSSRIAHAAASIRQIDGVRVGDLFQLPDTMSQEQKDALNAVEYTKRTWEIEQVFNWLSTLPIGVADELYMHYQKLVTARKEAIDSLKKSLARTSGGGSEATSSPENQS